MSEAEIAKYFLTKKVPYVKPVYSLNLSKDEEILDWFRDTDYQLFQYYTPLFREQKENLSYFLGSGVNPHFASPFAATFATTSDIYAEPQQLFINELYRLTMAQVSTIINNELVPEVLPNSENYSDKVACNVTKEWLDSMNYTLGTEQWRLRWELQKKMFGESFCVVSWNPDSGDVHPDAKQKTEQEFVFRDAQGLPILDVEGKEMKIKKNLRIGDVQYINPMPWEMMIDPKDKYEDSLWFYYKEWVDIEYLKKEYPKKKWDKPIVEKRFDPYSGQDRDDTNHVCIYYMFHRSHKFLPEGRYIVCSRENVLVNESLFLPTIINNQTLPLVRFLDLDMGFGVRGVPILFRNVKSIADAYNRVTNQIYNNLEMESPKFFVHETAGVDAQRMPNGIVAVEWRGNIKPSVETPSTNTSSIFNFRESLKRNADEIALQTPMVRGDTPNAQLDSFVSLQYFEDLRNMLASPDIKGHIRAMEQLFRLTIVTARDNYLPDDQRLIKILGKHNTYQLKYFDPINLQKAYDVKISTTGNLASSKAARNQMMISIKRDFPAIIADEVFLDMLGLSHSKKFMNAITAAVSAAEAENQSMYDGEEIPSPARFEDLITHWETHRIPMQTLDFKQSPEEIQELFIRHVTATEKLMFEQAAESPAFSQRLEQLRQFPMFYTPIPVNEVPLPPPGAEGLPPPPINPAPDSVPPEMLPPEIPQGIPA